ncbi:MAG: excinuclease ABC subunit UvrB [Planctomycetota bacterium]
MPDTANQPYQLVSEHRPMGDQPAAIDQLLRGVDLGQKYQTLLGATGTGKTFTMANVIARSNKPALIISHNKTLAAQLYEEMKELFPDNAVSYFVSYYDYYQPEAYIPQRDIYIEKDSSRNDDLDRLRLAATTNLVSRRDTIVVASVSCIFGLGSPDEYKKSVVSLNVGQMIDRQSLLRALADLQYTRSQFELSRGKFRVRGDVVELQPAAEEYAIRVELFGDEIDSLALINPTSGELLADERNVAIFPAVHYVMPENQLQQAIDGIKEELDHQVMKLRQQGKLLEAQRLLSRTKYDLEQIEELGYCNGVENYSRFFDNRPPGSRPYTLLDFFPDAITGDYSGGYADGSREDVEYADTTNASDDKGWLLFIDESHVTMPQIRAMYEGDQARKRVLVDHGFRLPSALDNRPLKFEEVEKSWDQVVFVSATPGPYELERSGGIVAEQIIRPTGLVDPVVEVRPAADQVSDVIEMARQRSENGERALITVLTKRMAEDLAKYLHDQDIKCRYLHSEVDTLDRVQILRELREGEFDVLVGVNLLREGLDLPEVSFVGILDADKEGYLRSATSLIQQIGRAARNVNAFVVLYADKVTPAIQAALDETTRRRDKQLAFNAEHGITPKTIKKAIRMGLEIELRARKTAMKALNEVDEKQYDRAELIAELERQMLDAAQALEFEKAAQLRDKVKQIKAMPTFDKVTMNDAEPKAKPGAPGTKSGKRRGKKPSRR